MWFITKIKLSKKFQIHSAKGRRRKKNPHINTLKVKKVIKYTFTKMYKCFILAHQMYVESKRIKTFFKTPTVWKATLFEFEVLYKHISNNT